MVTGSIERCGTAVPGATVRAGLASALSGPNGRFELSLFVAPGTSVEITAEIVLGTTLFRAVSAPIVVITGLTDVGTLTLLQDVGDVLFPAPKSWNIGHPTWGTTGDLDGDLDVDVVTAHSTGLLAVLLNEGHGATVSPPIQVPLSATPRRVLLADLDGDLMLDAVVGTTQGQVLVLLGRGDGTFEPPGLPIGSSPSAELLLADLDQDGILDLVSASLAGIEIHRGLGTGQFALLGQHPSAAGSSAFGDIDLDGDVDLAFTGGGSTFVLVNDGGGGFSTLFPAAPNGSAVALGDFNGDLLADLAIGTSGAVQVLLASGGAFLPSVATPVPTTNPFQLVAASLDPGSVSDLAFFNGNRAGTLLGNGDGTFRVQLLPVSPAPRYLDHFIVADFDGDVDIDLALVDAPPTSESSLTLLLNDCRGNLATKISSSSAHSEGSILAADLDGDGLLDAVTTGRISSVSSSSFVYTMKGRGDGRFGTGSYQASHRHLTGMLGDYPLAGDLDGDQRIDVAIAHDLAAAGISVLLGEGDTTLGPLAFHAGGTRLHGLVGGDFDHDGDLDLASAAFATPTRVTVWLGVGDGSFPAPQDYPGSLSSPCEGIACADVNGDGNLDLFPDTQGSSAAVFFGAGDGTFESAAPLALTGQSLLGDVDADGDADLLARTNADLFVRLNDGSGVFGPPIPSSTPSGVLRALRDLDADGNADLLGFAGGAGAGDYGWINVQLGRGDGTFRSALRFGGGYLTSDVTPEDFDQDGFSDIAASHHQESVSVHINRSDS